MLNDQYRYVSLDFETTGLNPKKDEIVQIGIVVLDHKGDIIDTYTSLVAPSDKKTISTIVTYITGLQESDLIHAPSIDAIQTKVRSFFDDKTIIIGHNSSFDIAFLERFFPGISYAGQIDTFTCAQTFVHFAPSLALEVLCQYLQEKPRFLKYWQQMLGQEESESTFHDALYDAKSAAALFCYCVDYMRHLCSLYVQIAAIRKKSSLPLFYQLIDTSDRQQKIPPTIHIPVLQKKVTTPQTMVKKIGTPNLEQYPSTTQCYIGNTSIKNIATYIAQHKNIICAFSHRTKADIMKHHLHDMGVYGIGSLYDDYFFDQQRFNLFINKKTFTAEECNFLCKYISHHEQGLGIVDMQQEVEKKIMYFLQESKPTSKSPIIFATHNILYQNIQKYPDKYKGYTIYFFDQDWWYITYNDFASHTYNPGDFVQAIEKIVYTYDVCRQTQPEKYTEKYKLIEDFYKFLQIFVGVLSMDTKRLFIQHNGSSFQCDPLLYHHNFYQTQQLWDTMLHRQEILQKEFPETIYKDIDTRITQLQTILSSMVTINKCMYGDGLFYFIYKETNRFIQRQEFQDVFTNHRTLFFSHHNKQNIVIDTEASYEAGGLPRIQIKNSYETIKKMMQDDNKIFIVSTQKAMTQELFTAIYEAGGHKEYTILAENITGGAGKNIFLAQKSPKAVMIGGYSFLLQCIAKGLTIDKTTVFFIRGSMEKLLLCDIQRYAKK